MTRQGKEGNYENQDEGRNRYEGRARQVAVDARGAEKSHSPVEQYRREKNREHNCDPDNRGLLVHGTTTKV